MPLGDLQTTCLDQLKGNDGIVSTVGRLMGGAGDAEPNEGGNPNYNTLSRIFFKGSGTQPRYISLTETNDTLYIGYPHNPLTDAAVQDLKQKLINFNGTDDSKIAIFKSMYLYKNHILGAILKFKVDWLNEQVQTAPDEDNIAAQQFFIELKDAFSKDNKTAQDIALADKAFFSDFVLNNDVLGAFGEFCDSIPNRIILPNLAIADNLFEHVFPNILDVRALLDGKEVVIANYVGDPGVHVDVKGVCYVKSQGVEHNNIFYIGLSHTYLVTPGCCVGCDSEFRAYSEVHPEHQFHRTGRYPYLFPPRNYQPSNLVKESDEIFTAFSKKINEKCIAGIAVAGNPAESQNHPFFAAFNAMINPPNPEVNQEDIAEHDVALVGGVEADDPAGSDLDINI